MVEGQAPSHSALVGGKHFVIDTVLGMAQRG